MFPSQSTPRLIALLAIAAAAGVVGLVVTGRVPDLPGTGGSKGKVDVRALVHEALSDPAIEGRMKSGKVHVDMDVTLTGVPPPMQSFLDMRFKSAFISRGVDRFAKQDMTIVLDMLGRHAELALASRDGRTAFLTIDGTTYAVPPAGVAEFERAEARDTDDDTNPATWLTDPEDAGTFVIEDEETTQVTASLDSAKMIADLERMSSQQDSARGDSSEEYYGQAKGAVRPGRVELFIAKSDGLVRRALVDVPFEAPRPGGGAPIGGNLEMAVNVSELNKPQRIAVPDADRPYSELDSAFTMDRVSSIFLGLLDRQVPSNLGAGGARSGGSSGTPAPEPAQADRELQQQAGGLPTEAQAYLGCVRKARDQAAVQACSPQLP